MSIQSDEKYREFLNELGSIRNLIEERNPEEARERCIKLKAACAASGIRSLHVVWNLAIACDYVGDWEQAFEAIREAVDLDPVAPPVWNSYRIIVERLRGTLTDPEFAPDAPQKPRMYELLLSANEVTPACHVAMARFLAHTGREGEALHLLDALTTLYPAYPDGWKELAKVARAASRPELALRAETELAAVGDGQAVPFTMNARASA